MGGCDLALFLLGDFGFQEKSLKPCTFLFINDVTH